LVYKNVFKQLTLAAHNLQLVRRQIRARKVAGNHHAAVMPDARALTKSIYIEYLFVLWSLISRAPPVRRIALAARGQSLSGLLKQVLNGFGRGGKNFVLFLCVQFHELSKIELGFLKNLSFVNEHVLERVEF